ncbi:porin [Caballeronia sordidicola]|uniref:porin n=1 Tax=Caballeronia sordidicola TaxID=196367 RepID=UPI0004D02FE4|nr:porin [Caballeronia sordidicola]
MKNSISTLSIATLVLFAGVAHAQSSVTLYGIADAGLVYNSNVKGGRQIALVGGNEGANRWGMIGSEDLGGGLKAIFNLEAGFNLANGTIGQNGTFWGRAATVGLSSADYGTVTLGRQNSDSWAAVGYLEAGNGWAASGAEYGAHPGDVDNLDNSNRLNNSILYRSKSYNGLTFGGAYSFGGKAGEFSQNQIWDLSAGYANGPVKLGVGYILAKDPNFSFFGNKANDSTTGINISSPVTAGYASAGSQQIIAAGGSYAFGPATVGVVYSNTQFQELGTVSVAGLNATEAAYRGTATFNTGELNFKYQFTPALLLGVSYSYTRNGGASNEGGARYQQVDLGAVYSFSKMTSVYAIAVHQAASGTDSTGERAVAAIAGTSGSSTNAETLVTVGLTHKF